jgi:CheY-like chemotaxis protein
MPDGGKLTIAAAAEEVAAGHRAALPPGRYVRLSVSDSGIGMDETTLARAIEPFFSTKGVGQGTGLGLSMVHGLAAQLGGGLSIRSRPGLGTSVELWLPVAAAAGAGPRPEAETPAKAAAGTALVVDDEELVRTTTGEMLADMGFRVVEAGSADAALRMIDGGLNPDIVVTDHLMPGLTGTQLARLLPSKRPGTPVLIVSGYADVEGIAPDLARLEKPFTRAELAAAIAKLSKPAPQARD